MKIRQKYAKVLITDWATFYQEQDANGDLIGDEVVCKANDGRTFGGYMAEEAFLTAILEDDYIWIHSQVRPYIQEIKNEAN
jgi:hypothetical protein